jgi:signal transduction histidine kinase
LRHLDQARATARENLVEARRLVAALRPEILEGSSLPEALRRLAVRWSESSGIPATLTVTGEERPIPQEAQVALLRTMQEALQNVRRHAGASAVNVTLSYMDDLVALDVQDDGRGFDPESVIAVGVERGFGLRAMRERVEALGGSLLVESEPGEGCTLAVELPVEGVRRAARSAGVEGEAL